MAEGAGSNGDRIVDIDRDQGWTAPRGANYGVLYDAVGCPAFAEGIERRSMSKRPLSHAFIVTDSTSEFQQIATKRPAGVVASRLYADCMRIFEVNTAG